MKSMMSRSPFSRSQRTNSDSTVPSHSHSQSSSALISRYSENSARPTAESRHGHTRSMEFQGMRRLEARRAMEEHHYLASKARARNYNPPVDLRLLDYVSPHDTNLMCAICRCPFVDPVVLSECDHCFCRDCIRQTWNTGSEYSPLGPRGNCPTCRTPAKLGPRSATHKILVNMTDDLIVKCPKADEGCPAEVKRGEIQDHVNIYCGYALMECAAEDCELPVLRKDAAQGCLHYGVSCLSCRKETQKWRLESHWRNECSERKVHCALCQSAVFYRGLEEHNKQTCPAIGISCPGAPFGCAHRSKNPEAEVHAKTCPLASLAPTLTKQQERLDEQEAAQMQLLRKIEVLESGFNAMHSILYPPRRDVESDRIGTNSEPTSYFSSRRNLLTTQGDVSTNPNDFTFLASSTPEDSAQDLAAGLQSFPTWSPPMRPVPDAPGPRPNDLPEPYTTDFDLEAPASFPPPDTTGGPYASPLHHLLSMHESLRDEISRISSALSELDGRHSMQSLNENLRTRDEISYLGAQVGGLQRQVHWLTSSQLQRQHVGGRSPTPGSAAPGASTAISDAAAGAGVEAAVSAVSTAATALRGAARMVNVGGREGSGLRRRTSEEGRTKL